MADTGNFEWKNTLTDSPLKDIVSPAERYNKKFRNFLKFVAFVGRVVFYNMAQYSVLYHKSVCNQY